MPQNNHSIKVDIHGSCVSRSIFNHIDTKNVHVGSYFARNNIISCMMSQTEFATERDALLPGASEYMNRCIQYSLSKDTVPKLLESDANFLVVDYFDLCQMVTVHKYTTFSNYDTLFFTTPYFKAHADEFSNIKSFFDIPCYLWYSYIDLYWNLMTQKFGKNILLVRLHCCSKYVSKTGKVFEIPAQKKLFGNADYNLQIAELEDYIIDRYSPYVLDISKYFIADETFNPDVTPVHFMGQYEESAWAMVKCILNGETSRYVDEIPPKATAEILNVQIADNQFRVLWDDIIPPFHTGYILDRIFDECDVDDVVKNRRWIAKCYHTAAKINNKSREGNVTLLDTILTWNIENSYQKELFLRMEKVRAYLQLDTATLYSRFLQALDHNNMEWISMLNCLSIGVLENADIQLYQYQYAVAIEDNTLIKKLQQNYR